MTIPSHLEVRRRLIKLISDGNLMPLVFSIDGIMRDALTKGKYPTLAHWHKSPERRTLKMAILVFGSFAGSPPPADLKMTAATKRLFRAHFKACDKLQANMKTTMLKLLENPTKQKP